MFKMICLQYLNDFSDWEVEKQPTFKLLYKSFFGLSTEELPLHHATLCPLRARSGAEGFQTLVNPMVPEARVRRLVSGKVPILDAMHLDSKVYLFRLEEGYCRGSDEQAKTDRYFFNQEACFGLKNKVRIFPAKRPTWWRRGVQSHRGGETNPSNALN